MTTKKRILLVTRPIAPPWDEASKNFAWTLAQNLPDFDFGLLTNGKLDNLAPNIIPYPIYTSNKLDALQKFRLFKFLARSEKNSFDVLHFLFTPTIVSSFLLNNLFNKKLKAVTIQTVATLREDLYSDKTIKKLIFADVVVTYSKHAKDKLKSLGLGNVFQIYPGINLEIYKPARKDVQLMEKMNLVERDFVITYPGEFTRLGATEDILDVLLKYADLLSKHNIKIIFACRIKNKKDQRMKDKIEKSFREKGLHELVRLPETFVTMEKVFNLSDAIVFPVRNMHGKFDVPLAVIEAMACAKPVIISDLPMLREFSNNNNSVIIKAGDTKKLIESILYLRQNKDNLAAIGENARGFAVDNFDIQKIAAQYKKIYEKQQKDLIV